MHAPHLSARLTARPAPSSIVQGHGCSRTDSARIRALATSSAAPCRKPPLRQRSAPPLRVTATDSPVDDSSDPDLFLAEDELDLVQSALSDTDTDNTEFRGDNFESPAPSISGADYDEEDDRESREFAFALARVAVETKGGDVTLLHVAPLVYWTSYMLVVSVFSRPQLNAILAKMEKEAEGGEWGRQLPEHKKPGRGVWEVLDYGDVVVHVMTPEERDYYDIESFYGAAEEVELPFDEPTTEGQWQTSRM